MPLGDVVHVLDDVRIHLQRLAEEFLHAVAGEQFLEREARQKIDPAARTPIGISIHSGLSCAAS